MMALTMGAMSDRKRHVASAKRMSAADATMALVVRFHGGDENFGGFGDCVDRDVDGAALDGAPAGVESMATTS